jgi:hypothetical protein
MKYRDEANTTQFWMEVIVIVLILGEILISVYEGHGQTSLIAAQTEVLRNLQASTKNTADSLAAQLALQYEVFVNVQYNEQRGISLFNNSKNRIVFFGIKVGDRPAESNPEGPTPIAGLMMKTIRLEEFYPNLFDNLPKTGSVDVPITLYLKSANDREYVAEGTFTFSRRAGNSVSGFGESTVRAEKWSNLVRFSQPPSGTRQPAPTLQTSH